MAANQSSTRIHNKREIIETLMQEGDMSRAGLAKKLKLSKPATAENVDGLIQAGLVLEIGEGTSAPGGGRKPRLLRFNQRYRGIAVVDLCYTHPVLAIGDLAGEILAEMQLTAGPKVDKVQKAEILKQAIHHLLEEANGIDLEMIILSSPGIFTSDSKLVYANPQHSWADVGIEKVLTEYFAVPVIIKNDMNVAVLGEFELGSGKGCSNMVYVGCGVGLGAGLVLEGKLYEGKGFAAGEISYFTNREDVRSKRKIEDRVRIEALLAKVEADIKANKASQAVMKLYAEKGSLEFRDIVRLAAAKDDYTVGLIREIGEELGVVLASIGALLDVEKIVLGGEYLDFFDILAGPVQEILDQSTPIPPEFVPSALKEKVGLLGGFIFGRNMLFSNLAL